VSDDEFASLTKGCRKAEDGRSDDLAKWNGGKVDIWTSG